VLKFVCFAGEADSHVFGSLSDGVFEGKVVSAKDGAFYVEKAHHYFPKEANATFHSVIYHADNVTDPYEHMRTGMKNSATDSISSMKNSAP